MRKLLKISLISLAVLVVLGLLATAALRIAFPPAKLRRIVEDQIRKQLNREARLGAVELGLRGLALQRFTLSEVPSFSAGTFLEVDQARLRWNLLSFSPRKVVLHIREGVVHSGTGSARLTSALSDIDLAVWDFDATRAQGRLSVAQCRNPVYHARDFSVDWNLRDIDSSLARLSGWMRLKQGPGLVQNIDKLAAASQGARLALMPLLVLQNVEKTGLVHLGLPDLNHLEISDVAGDYTFTNGLMQINHFDINGPQLSVDAKGTINLASGVLAVNVTLHAPQPTLMGATDLKISVGGTLSNPKTNLDSLKKQAFKATVSEVLKNPDALKNLQKLFR